MYDDKLVCSHRDPTAYERACVLLFFRCYAAAKGLLNRWRGRPGRTACEGWLDAGDAIARARPRDAAWRGSNVPF